MNINYLSIKGLYPPSASGGLWRTWCLLLFSGIRHYPPKPCGGVNYLGNRNLTNIRHLAAKRISTVIIYGRLRKKIYEFEKKSENMNFVVDIHQLYDKVLSMIIELIRKQIETCGKSRYQISKETGIDKAALCRIMQGGSCKVETADILLKYFGLTINKDKKKAR